MNTSGTNRLSVLIVFGGESSEHDVSVSSARNVHEAIDKNTYDISLCYISADGSRWSLVKSFAQRDGPELLPNLGKGLFVADGKDMHIDVIMPILHGKHGEDGEVQGLASLMHIACTGPSLIGAAVCMDKDLTKHLLRDTGIPVVDWFIWRVGNQMPSYNNVTSTLGAQLFIKPSKAGSSIGVSKVASEAEFVNALTVAGQYDDIVLIERAVSAREIELAVLGNEDVRISTPGEVVAEADFYSYDAKYASNSRSHAEIPAVLDHGVAGRLKEYARRAYETVRGQGMARIDFFLTDDGDIFLNEINTIPGFTDISMYPKMWNHDGVEYSELIAMLIELAFDARQ